jgi:uncharacterized protein
VHFESADGSESTLPRQSTKIILYISLVTIANYCQSAYKVGKMRVKVDNISDSGTSLAVEENAESFPSLADLVRTGECDFLTPVAIALRLRRSGDVFETDGRFETRVRLVCSRCLASYETPLAADFTFCFSRQEPVALDPVRHAEIELRAEDIGLIIFQGDDIDLCDALQEEVLMALPMRSLCRPDCKGLCQKCGADLNQADCGCERKRLDPSFAVLKGLKPAKK